MGDGGKDTKKGNHGREKQIEAEKKTLKRQKQEERKDGQFRGQHRAKWTGVMWTTSVSVATSLITEPS